MLFGRKIDLIKVEDDYYYVSFIFNYNTYYYRLDQLIELKKFMKLLNNFKQKMKKI